ncbi:8-amino-7-oxononanoate synthase protein [Cryptosporidium andersoni]|uniref:8-amino-7-oxononanoate synthase protein n=1 Tax=Cryptosporidium andersoni TaxID=117008 RepID=A0A1J4MTY3_9CRYT|nr:8-amino-7-oxononanoate synthase protein [Cryptosporidium andersoni]
MDFASGFFGDIAHGLRVLNLVDTLLVVVVGVGIYLAVNGESAKALYGLLPGTKCDSGSSGKTSKSAFGWLSSIIKQIRDAYVEGTLVSLLSRWTESCVKIVRLAITCYLLEAISQSRRHYFYLLEKKFLKLEIRKGETEKESYVDIKKHLQRKGVWPYMQEVSQPRSDKVLCEGYEATPMSSYSYLDLVYDERVQKKAIEAAQQYSTGSHGPRMLGGNTPLLRELEKAVGEFFGREDSLIVATGYMACMGAVCAIYKKGDVFFGDDRLHASIRAGFKVSGAKVYFFKHNNMAHLEQLVKQYRRKYRDAWIFIESVYSMDGDIAPLPDVRSIADKYDMKICIDEAHGMGVLGKMGRGLEEHFNMPGAADVIVGTFSKSAAGVGGYITSNKLFVDFLDFHTPGNTFSAALPAYCAGGVLESLRIISSEPERVEKCRKNSLYLRNLIKSGGGYWPADYPEDKKYTVEGDDCTSVIAVVFKDDILRVIDVAHEMLKRGWLLSCVAFPACPLRFPRFRVTARAGYTQQLMDNFVKDLVECSVACPGSELTDSM